jgi:hypothetical protein
MHVTLFAICLLLGGCGTTAALQRDALRHEDRAAVLSQKGQGEAALEERQKAENLRATARLRAEQPGTWLWSDLTMR